MNILFYPNTAQYSTAHYHVAIDVTSLRQFKSIYNDGYVSSMSISDVCRFLRSVNHNSIDHQTINAVIACIECHFLTHKDFFEHDAIFVFEKFVSEKVLDLNYRYKCKEFI